MNDNTAPTRDLANRLGDYFGREAIAPIPQITEPVVSLNPRAWPPCRHCDAGVNCPDYDPDTQAPLWGSQSLSQGDAR